MKYLALVYYQESAMNQMSQQEWDALNRECIACVGSLQQSGNFLDGAPLEQSPSATTIRVRDDKLLVTDGPFAETKEQLAGYYLLEANDLNQAIQLARAGSSFQSSPGVAPRRGRTTSSCQQQQWNQLNLK